MSKKQEARKKASELYDQLVKEGRIKTSYTVETVYSCILKDGKLEVEDNREKFMGLMHPYKSAFESDTE
jgi:polyhydroxyalkanoate synthesis regulator phasin